MLLFLFPVSFFSNWKGSRTNSEETFQMILTLPSRKVWSVSLHWELLESSIHLPGEGYGTPLQYSCLENPMGGGAWWAAVHGVAKSWTRLSDFTFNFHFSLSCIGEGNGNPLQCSCLENPRDGGACWAAVCGVPQSRTQLEWLSSNWLSISSVQLLSRVRLFATPRTAACQASLSITKCQSLLKLMSIS